MKNILIVLIGMLVLTTILSNLSCSENVPDRQRFTDAYYEILVARESMQDTAESNIEVNKIYSKYDYSIKSFKDDYFYFAKETDTFIAIVDSMRNRAKEDAKRIRDSIMQSTMEKINSDNISE